MNATTMTTLLDGIQISYMDRPGRDPTIVCMHANSLNKDAFTDLINQDAVSANRIVAFDLPGHGESGRSVDQRVYSFRGYGTILAKLIRELDLSDFVLVGVSLGGHIVLQAAAAERIPRPRGIACFGSPPIGDASDLSRGYLPQPEHLSLFRGEIDPETAREIANAMTIEGSVQERTAAAILATDPTARTALFASLGSLPLENERAFVTSTTLPIRLCYDRNEQVVNTDYLSDTGLLQRIPHSIVSYDGAGHLPRMDVVADVLGELLSETGTAGG